MTWLSKSLFLRDWPKFVVRKWLRPLGHLTVLWTSVSIPIEVTHMRVRCV